MKGRTKFPSNVDARDGVFDPNGPKSRDRHSAECPTVEFLQRTNTAPVLSDTPMDALPDFGEVPMVLVEDYGGRLVGTLPADDHCDGFAAEPPSLLPSGVPLLDELAEAFGDGFHVESIPTVADAMSRIDAFARPHWSVRRALAVMDTHGLDALPVIPYGSHSASGLILRSDVEAVVGGSRFLWNSTVRLWNEGSGAPVWAVLTAEAEALLSAQGPCRPSARSTSEMARALRKYCTMLYQSLSEHYGALEASDLYLDTPRSFPELAWRVADSVERHHTICERLTELLLLDDDALVVAAAQVLDHVKRCDAAEDELVRAVCGSDVTRDVAPFEVNASLLCAA